MNDLADRDMRQRSILPPEKLAACRATVIGVGAIGRQVVLQLAAIGMPRIQLVDFDHVEAVNLAPQGFFEEDLGKYKVEATAALIQKINPSINVEMLPEKFRRNMVLGDVVFCCVDKIDTRKFLSEICIPRSRFFCDARMSAETIRVLTVAGSQGTKHYPTTLFAASEAFAGACTAKSTIFTANIAAALMLASFAQWLRGMPLEVDVMLNLLAWELTVNTPK